MVTGARNCGEGSPVWSIELVGGPAVAPIYIAIVVMDRTSLPEGLDLGVLPGMAQAVRALDCPLGAMTRLSAGGGALPVIISIIGPRETRDYY